MDKELTHEEAAEAVREMRPLIDDLAAVILKWYPDVGTNQFDHFKACFALADLLGGLMSIVLLRNGTHDAFESNLEQLVHGIRETALRVAAENTTITKN